MQVLVILLAFFLPLDSLGFSWPRQTKETILMDEEVIPEGLSKLGRSSLFVR
jgi:hypothetical protein